MRLLILVFILCYSSLCSSQMDEITLTNPSFEESPKKGGSSSTIRGWYDCGIINFPKESAPDIHPNNIWSVTLEPYHGDTYLGLVVRDNDSWESLSQRLSTPLEAGNCYTMAMAVTQSEKYISGSRLQSMKGDKTQSYNYQTPAVVRIYGGSGYCNKKELLATSAIVDNSEWEILEFDFTPEYDIKFISIQAYYKLPVLVPYNGHVLIDDLSNIIQIECIE